METGIEMSKLYETEIIKKLPKVFKNRYKSPTKTESKQISSYELECIDRLMEKSWSEITASFLEDNCCINFLSSDNFKYFLPAIVNVSIRENKVYLLAIEIVIMMLDRPADTKNWDDDFVSKWLGLELGEYRLIQDWLFWLCDAREEDTLSILRCIETIELLILETENLK